MNSAVFCGLVGAISLALVAFGVLYGFLIWDECREAGHSVLYCMRMVTR